MRTIIVIPVLNEEAYIQHCLDCLQVQTVAADEVIIVDNGSTDKTIAICKQYAFVRIVSEGTRGICAATKHGLDKAVDAADIILRCDADSRPKRNWVERTRAFFDDPAVVAVTGPGEFYDLSGIKKWLAEICYMRFYFLAVRLALRQWPVFGSNFALRSSVWKEISSDTHLSRQDIHDDMDISYHVAPKGKIIYDRSLVMPISARPFKSVRSLLNRFPIGMRSILIHWPRQAPWKL